MIVRPECLIKLVNRGSFHGSELAIAYGTPADDQPGLADSVWFAESALRDAERYGWIERGIYRPSRDQQCFGLSGFTGSQLAKLPLEQRPPGGYHWITCTFKWLTPDVVEEAIASDYLR